MWGLLMGVASVVREVLRVKWKLASDLHPLLRPSRWGNG